MRAEGRPSPWPGGGGRPVPCGGVTWLPPKGSSATQQVEEDGEALGQEGRPQ